MAPLQSLSRSSQTSRHREHGCALVVAVVAREPTVQRPLDRSSSRCRVAIRPDLGGHPRLVVVVVARAVGVEAVVPLSGAPGKYSGDQPSEPSETSASTLD